MIRIDRPWAAGLMLAASCILAACSDDKIVYRDDDVIAPPPAAGEFIGYSSTESKKTICGNCHIGKQASWQQTAHASAWKGLQASGAAQDFCEACHTVSSKGNRVTEENVGWVSTRDPRYHDVQCESCHGPGTTHVSNPDASTKPLASLAVDTALGSGCVECHSGAHRPFAEEWSKSNHARVIVSRATNPACVGCHEAKSILRGWGVKSAFLEDTAATTYLPVTCAVCHDPHDATNEGQLRYRIDVPDMDLNLCMKCHRRRANPDQGSSYGPHSPEGPLLLGTAGWFPPNFPYAPGTLVGTHGSENNPRVCATCHVNDYSYTDPLTGNFAARATGHSFQPIPCVDAAGVPTGERDCDISARSFRSCTSCHPSETSARTSLLMAEQRLERLAEEIDALLPLIPATEFKTGDNKITTGEGARFNRDLARKPGSAAHNPFLVEALLLASIDQVRIDYGIQASAAVSLQPQLTTRR